jgi:outer membrane protein
MKKLCIALAVAAVAPLAMAQSAGDIVMRVRAVDLQSANTNSADLKATLSAVATVPAEASINDKWIPEVDFSYFVTSNIAAELILTYPQKQDLYLNAGGTQAKIATFKHLPPTLTAQYHFTGLGAFKPYLGAGVNYTRLSRVSFDPALSGLGLELKKNSFGLAFQAGADYALDKKWSLNLDVKKVQIKTEVSSNGTKIGTFKVDPLLVGMGVGYKF